MTDNFDHDMLNEMCQKIDLLEYAQQSMDFIQRGGKFFTSCPLHSDSDPSLCISPDENLWYCFSCKRGGNIINWMMIYEKLRFNEAIEKISQITGTELRELRICDSLKYFKELIKIAQERIGKPVERAVLPDTYLDKFVKDPPREWIDEGISEEVMSEYGVCIDYVSNRICYPIYDNNDNLIGVKGRTRFPNFKDLKITKYISYNKIQTTDFLVGMKQNRDEIKRSGSVFIFEGIKSGMKMTTWGLGKNWLAAETSRLNDAQVRVLLDLHINEVNIAFDRDVDIKEIRKCTQLLKRFCNVYVIRDRYNRNRLLPGDKDSPVDAGKEVWEQLVREKVRL